SWPKIGDLYETALEAYGLSLGEALSWKGPLDDLKQRDQFAVPVMFVAGGNDQVVPWKENGELLEHLLRKLGCPVSSIVKATCGHHPHSLHDPTPIVDWVESLR
ncbi:MAG: hypothetical protein AAF236_12445, partial [Verrucomicrobiota bacterium]